MRAAKVDANQSEIVRAWRDVGATVQLLHTVGHGCPDALVGYQGINYVAEIKTETGRLNSRERRWHDEWHGQKAIVRTVREGLAMLGLEVEGVEEESAH